MSPRSVLLAPLLLPLLAFAAGDAAAYTAYVTNEKDNTVSVVDLDKMETVKTIPVGERPRGILLSKDKKYIYICNGDADHIEMINLDTLQIERTLDSGPDPELFALDQKGNKLYIANEDNAMVTVARPDAGFDAGADPGRGGARGHGGEPRRQISRRHLRDHQHGAFHRPRHAAGRRQRAGRRPPALRRLHPRRQICAGLIGDRRHRQRHRRGDQEDREDDRLRDPGRRQADHPGRRRQYHGGRQDGLRRPGPGEPGGRRRSLEFRGEEISAGGPAGLAYRSSRPTGSISSRRTAIRTTSRSSTSRR